MRASPTSLVVNSAARISSVCSSIPMWILRQTRRLGPPCLRAFHSPSPSTLIPVLSTKRCNGPCDPRKGILTFSTLWRRRSVLKSGTAQSKPISRETGSRRTPSSGGAPCRTAPSSSDRSRSPHRCSRAADHACRWAQPPRSSRDQTRSSANHDA